MARALEMLYMSSVEPKILKEWHSYRKWLSARTACFPRTLFHQLTNNQAVPLRLPHEYTLFKDIRDAYETRGDKNVLPSAKLKQLALSAGELYVQYFLLKYTLNDNYYHNEVLINTNLRVWTQYVGNGKVADSYFDRNAWLTMISARR